MFGEIGHLSLPVAMGWMAVGLRDPPVSGTDGEWLVPGRRIRSVDMDGAYLVIGDRTLARPEGSPGMMRPRAERHLGGV